MNKTQQILCNDVTGMANHLLNTIWIIDAIPYHLKSMGWTFVFNNAKTALGNCRGAFKTISVSKYILECNPDMALWEDTIKHEISHAIDFEQRGFSNHDVRWVQIGNQVGCETLRLYDGSNLNFAEAKYVLKCDYCGSETRSHRIRKKLPACKPCCGEHNNGKFTDKFILRQIIN